MAGLSFEQITGLELRAVRRETERTLSDLVQHDPLELAYVMHWLAARRNGQPQLEYEAVLALPFEEVAASVEGLDNEDPTTAGGGAT